MPERRNGLTSNRRALPRGYVIAVLFPTSSQQVMIQKRDGSHCLHDWHRTGLYTGVMPSTSLDRGVVSQYVNCLLFLQDGGHWFESDPEIDVLTIGNTRLYST